MTVENDTSGPGVMFPPPLVFLIMMLAAYAIHRVWPAGTGTSSEIRYVGVVIAISGIYMIVWVSRTFRRAKTNIQPWKPTTKVISTGFYAYSRNPVYVGFCFVPVGIGVFLNNFWILVSFIPSAIIVYFIAICKEEAYLEEKFGEAYKDYKSKVRRWL